MSEPQALASADELARAGSAELASLDAFVRAHYPRLVRLAGLITRDSEQAQDAVQAALERAWRKRDDVRDPAKIRPWLDRIVAREAIRQTRGTGLTALLSRGPEEWIQHPSSMPEPAEAVVLREALGRLSPNHRAVIALHLHEGYSVEETAGVLGVPIDTVRSRLRAARQHLRRELAESAP